MKNSRTNESLKRELCGADIHAAYDDHAKRLLAQKIVLAHILVSTVSEFKDLEPEAVVFLIETEPEVSSIPVNPGDAGLSSQTSAEGTSKEPMPVITGSNTESQIPYEGKITYDVHFFAWTPGKKGRIKIILDVEAQKNFHPGYHIVSRGIFYTSRMISSQLDTEFRIPNYDDIKKVYSIWICMNPPERVRNTITEFSIDKKDLVGSSGDLGKYDLLSVIIIGISEKITSESEKTKLNQFLGTLFSANISAEQKMEILSREFNIELDSDSERRIHIMCNLSEGIEEKGIEKGIEQERKRLITSFLRSDNHIDHAVKLLGLSEEVILSVARKEGIRVKFN